MSSAGHRCAARRLPLAGAGPPGLTTILTKRVVLPAITRCGPRQRPSGMMAQGNFLAPGVDAFLPNRVCSFLRLGGLWFTRSVGARCPARLRFFIFILYLDDDSGSVKNPRERHFVLAGIAVYERQAYHLISRADSFVSSLNLDEVHDIELHGSTMANGKKASWKGMSRLERLDAIERGLGLLRDAHWSVKAFAVAVDKHETAENDPVEYAFEELCNRFNLFLARLHRNGDTQRGLIVMDKWHYEDALQRLARGFRDDGTRWGQLRNLAEVPLFRRLYRVPADPDSRPSSLGGLETIRVQ